MSKFCQLFDCIGKSRTSGKKTIFNIRREDRPMTEAELVKFKRVFLSMDKVFDHMDELFEEVNKKNA